MIRARAWSLYCDSYDDANAVETLGTKAESPLAFHLPIEDTAMLLGR